MVNLKNLYDIKWHSLNLKDVLATLNSSTAGLSSVEALQRQQEYGFNELPKRRVPSCG